MDDKTLIKKVRNGDKSAINILVESNKNIIWHIIISMVGHNSNSEDLFQEVFLKVFKGLNKFRSDSQLSTWIGSITHHVCIDYLRKKNKTTDLHESDFKTEKSINYAHDKSWKQPEKEDLNKVILAAIAKLPIAYRTAITLYHLDERSYREISKITGMPDGTVKSYINRGRNLLREMLISIIPDIAEIIEDL